MKLLTVFICLTPLMLAACGSDTTVVEKQPIVVQQPAPVVVTH
jgi:uncharacterized protein YcfL